MIGSKRFYYTLAILILIISVLLFWSYNLERFTLLGIVIPLISLITAIIYFYLGSKKIINLFSKISIYSSIILLILSSMGIIFSLILTYILLKPGSYGEIQNVFRIDSIQFNIFLMIALFSAIISLFYKE